MTYEYDIKKKAMKFIRKQQPNQQKRILEAIYALPLTGDVKKLKGEDDLYRLRVGDFRVLFELNQKTNTITLVCVTDADNRGQIYK
ncbi:MAG: type II toxin-antitoxin system RelE/ParE family toxin [Oscillospiraceae bacterium]|nr:type II toxin-antitoxin system RelE/ParE family toxin [Oscillospiraceae bacterium]